MAYIVIVLRVPMDGSKNFSLGLGVLAGMSRLALGLALGIIPSCASTAFDDGASVTEDTADLDSAAADADASDAVCTKGRFRCFARAKAGGASGRFKALAVPQGYGPSDLQSAYKINPNATATAKPTVAIVGAYGYPALESDLAVYRSTYGLPACTVASGCLKIVNQNGAVSPLPSPPPPDDDWTVETALDVDMVSAACPKCNILVVQAEDNLGEGLFLAQAAAAQLGATVISNSWGGPEPKGTTPAETAQIAAQMAQIDEVFDQPGIAVFVAAGDDGFNDGGEGPDFPGTSSHVISVGGTRLVRDASARGWSETAWSNGGSACSLFIPKPAYQTLSPCALKATADIAAVGDPVTGVAVYNAGAKDGPWLTVGGTSAASPFVAGVYAATGNGTQTSGSFLAANTSKLFDVVSGNNGNCGTDTLLCNAKAGWDGPTGYGTPNAQALGGSAIPSNSGSGSGAGSDAGSASSGNNDLVGGCSVGGGSGAGMLLLVGLLGLRRRRR
jgi:MYXO-CTERM domain-containing protein